MATKTEETKTVKIVLQRTRPDEPDEFVSVNNETFLIRRGEEVEIPDYVYEVLKRSQEQKLKNFEAMATLQKKGQGA